MEGAVACVLARLPGGRRRGGGGWRPSGGLVAVQGGQSSASSASSDAPVAPYPLPHRGHIVLWHFMSSLFGVFRVHCRSAALLHAAGTPAPSGVKGSLGSPGLSRAACGQRSPAAALEKSGEGSIRGPGHCTPPRPLRAARSAYRAPRRGVREGRFRGDRRGTIAEKPPSDFSTGSSGKAPTPTHTGSQQQKGAVKKQARISPRR